MLIRLPDRDAVTDVFDYLLGSFYGLQRAFELSFVDRPGGWHSTYRPHLPQYVEAIQAGKPPHEMWLAGFYFNSSIQRLAACFDRIPKLLHATGNNALDRMASVNTNPYDGWHAVYREINAYKHDAAGRAAGRNVGMAEASEAFCQAVDLLVASESKLVELYA